MIMAIALALGAAACAALLPAAVLFAEVLLASTTRVRRLPEAAERPRLAVLVPAHDEASVIAQTLRSIIPELREADRLLVVADNCNDETAAVASAQGAEAIVRSDPQHRGKGYALHFGIRHLKSDSPEIVIVIDADCIVAAGAIDRLARVCKITNRPIQALYLMRYPQNAGPTTRIAEFAWIVKNQVRPLGLHRLHLPCQLMGTGMAFPWQRIASAPLATGHIAEDLKLGVDLAVAGTAPLFCPEALVTSTPPASREGIRTQRTRWEHGHLAVIFSDAWRLLFRSLADRNLDSMAMALDLTVPPLALLTLVVLTLWIASGLLWICCAMRLPFIIATVDNALVATAVLSAWMRYGRSILPFHALACGVLYALRKIPLYAKFLFARQLDWVRSKRDDEIDPPTR
jgi:cellulose synthase/poly-beta-1,6-N-acetylglucosamine synthase-like glycosyltransferase